jgi:hypothetical protein
MDLKYANNKLIADDHPQAPGDYRKILSGSVLGSDYYIVGGITELNFNIRSENLTGDGGGSASAATKGTFGGSMYVMNIAADLRLVNSITLEVVDVVSVQKQIIGRQVSAGIFSFLGTNFFDTSVGESALEPIQLAVRSVIERGVLAMVGRAYGAPGGCSAPVDYLSPSYAAAPAPMPYPQAYAAPAPYQQPYAFPGAYQQPYAYQQPGSYRPMEMSNAYTRQNPYSGYAAVDNEFDLGLRGSF